MKPEKFTRMLLQKMDALQKESGDAFLELMVDTIILKDRKGQETGILYGFEYNLTRSRHWDKEQSIYILHDGFTDAHMMNLYKALCRFEPKPYMLTVNIEGIDDLDEAIHGTLEMEFDDIHE